MAHVDAKPISTRIKKMLLHMGIPSCKIELNDFAWILKHLDRGHSLFPYVWPLLIREYNQKGN